MDCEEVPYDYEPMDVDLSANSITKMDYTNPSMNASGTELIEDTKPKVKREKEDSSSRASPKTMPWRVRRYKIKIKRERIRKEETMAQRTKYTLFIFLVPIAAIIAYYFSNVICVDDLDHLFIENNLSQKLYGQSIAVKNLMNAIKSDSSSKILFLYGGTGVGKSYAVSLMFENLWKCSNVYHYTMPSFPELSNQLMPGFLLCKSAIIVVDDLTINNIIHTKTALSNLITKSKDLNKNITVILIFNCDNITENFMKSCDEMFLETLKDNFKDIDVYKKYIKFDRLTNNELLQCIKKELADNKVDKNKLKNILKNFNVTLDGCKGVYTKIKFLNIV